MKWLNVALILVSSMALARTNHVCSSRERAQRMSNRLAREEAVSIGETWGRVRRLILTMRHAGHKGLAEGLLRRGRKLSISRMRTTRSC